MQTTDVAILVPAFNPAQGWSRQLLDEWECFRKELGNMSWSFILVNDGTTTADFEQELSYLLSEEPSIQIIQQPVNMGKGAALRKAMELAKANVYLLTDIDFPYTTESMLRIVNELHNGSGADITAGNRKKDYYKKVPWLRSQLSLFLRWLIRKRLHLPFDDTQCGLKAMNEKGRQIFLQTKTNRYLYDLELMVRAVAEKNITIKPVPVQLREGILLRRMSFRILFQEATNFMKILLFRNRL